MSKMSNTTYFIRGTISIRIKGNKGNKGGLIYITPCTGFLTPDKPLRAIAYPCSKKKIKAKLTKLSDEKRLECDASGIKTYLPTLLAVAAQQKPVELRLKMQKSAKLTITGFVFPVPS